MSVLEFEADIDYVTDNGNDPLEKVWVRNEGDGIYYPFFSGREMSEREMDNHELRAENASLRMENERLTEALEALHDAKTEDEILRLEKEVARLKAKMEEWARLFEDNARDYEQYGSWMEAEDWFAYAGDMRIDILNPDETEKVQA